jgi:hypothetical protein
MTKLFLLPSGLVCGAVVFLDTQIWGAAGVT